MIKGDSKGEKLEYGNDEPTSWYFALLGRVMMLVCIHVFKEKSKRMMDALGAIQPWEMQEYARE